MIDFRYHIVSLVSVFLALAVGIIIGSFALRGGVGEALQGQVDDLRGNNSKLHEQLDRSQDAAQRQDQYAEDIAPTALAGQLKGKRIAVMALPGTEDSLVNGSRSSLESAGATVTTTVRLDDSWVSDTGPEQERQLTTAATTLGLDAEKIPKNRLAGRVLVEAVARQSAANAPDATATGVLKQLKDDDLLSVEPANPVQAEAVLVLWPGMTGKGDDNSSVVKSWNDVITGVGLSGRPAVGASAGPVDNDPTSPDALVSGLRNSPEVTGVMSTVDDGERAVGKAAIVLTLRDESRGRSGHFGLAKDATAVAPPIAED